MLERKTKNFSYTEFYKFVNEDFPMLVETKPPVLWSIWLIKCIPPHVKFKIHV